MSGQKKLLGLIIAVVVIMGGLSYFYIHHKTEIKADKAGMKNSRVCKNDDGDWMRIPAGFFKGGDGTCVEGAPPPPPAPRVIPPSERPQTSRTFDVPREGLRKWLEPGSKRYPKGGGIKTSMPNGRSYISRPGVDHDGENNPAGWFEFFPDPPGSKRQIEIYNRW